MLRTPLRCWWILLLLFASRAWAAEPVKRYAVIVANNQSLDEGVAPLAYAVDDGAKYLELFEAAGAQTALLASFDADSARRHPDAASVATPPRRADVLAATERMFAQIRADAQAGRETHFYFVYTGHGSLGPNREGYVNLADARFKRSELYREILARSPATFNHVILDACYAYFLVLKRGGKDKEGDFRAAVRDFLRAEELASYPNTGVLLASSTDSETHEWSLWEAGIFSHELRSGLLGPADVDGDGLVTYAEAAAFIEAANAAIDVPKARLRVFYRPPPARKDVPLLDLAPLRAGPVPTLEIEPEHVGQYYLEDSLGVRVADLHPTSEQSVRVALLGKAPFWLRTSEREALLPAKAQVVASQLAFAPLSATAKGSVEQTFRKSLFLVPFGLSFYRGAVAERGRLEEEFVVEERLVQRAEIRPKLVWGIGTLAAAVAIGATSAAVYGMAADAHGQYETAKTQQDAQRLHAMTQDRLYASRTLAGVAGAAAIAGVVLLVVDAKEKPSIAVNIAPGPSSVSAGVSGRW